MDSLLITIPNNRSLLYGPHRQRGVTLIEILITLLVLAVGLLGLAALQGVSLQTGQVAYQQTQAVNIAYEVADFARANRSRSDGWLKARSEELGQSLAGQHLTNGNAIVLIQGDDRIDITISWDEGRLEDLDAENGQEVKMNTRI